MIIQEFINKLKKLAPLDYAEDFDNVGLIVGNQNDTISGVLISLDATEEIVNEAIENKCNLILCFHPILFSGVKKLTPNNYVNRSVIKAIKNDISIFAIHTALDNSIVGVNRMIFNKIGLLNPKILIPQKGTIKKLTIYCPTKEADFLRKKLFEVGAGEIGNYSNCSFNSKGLGTYKANKDANPSLGEINKLHKEEEIQINITYTKHLESKILSQLFKHHTYEEVAYEIETLENKNEQIGMGMIGEFSEKLNEEDFLTLLKNKFGTPCIKHSAFTKKEIKKVAVLGGSGAFAINNAKMAGADVYVTADLKYHDFFKAENEILLADIGHYESEQYTKDLLYDFVSENFTNFAIVLSNTNTNPVQYF